MGLEILGKLELQGLDLIGHILMTSRKIYGHQDKDSISKVKQLFCAKEKRKEKGPQGRLRNKREDCVKGLAHQRQGQQRQKMTESS